jgi:DNA repair exonuclease SbcCD ATPase subunit
LKDIKLHLENINNIYVKAQRLIGKRDTILENIDKFRKQENVSVLAADIVSKAKTLLELFVKGTENQIKEYIEPTVTESLNFIFNQNLYFHIVFVTRRGQVEIDFIVISTKEVEEKYQLYLSDNEKYKKELEELIDSYKDLNFLYGGAIQEVLGLVLRLLLVELLGIKGPVILDEPTSSVHEEYASRVGVFIKSLSDRFNRQIIYVTHSHALAASADKCYEVKKVDEISIVEEI